MNDIAKRTEAPRPALDTGGAISAMVPRNIEEAFRLSQALAASGDMVPKHFQGKPEMVMAAVLRGAEIGLAPMQALSNIAVINGRASIWGDALPALMQRAGHDIDSVVEGEGDKMVATATLTRGDTGKEIVRTFSVEDAKKAGLWGKQGPWQTYPKRMLAMRARAWACRDGAADALMGLQVAEEASDMKPMRDVTPKEPAPGSFADVARRGAEAARKPQESDETIPDAEAPDDLDLTPDAPADGTDASDGASFTIDDINLDDAFPGSDEFGEGVDAFKAGKAMTACPYMDDRDKATDWFGGWTGAKTAANE